MISLRAAAAAGCAALLLAMSAGAASAIPPPPAVVHTDSGDVAGNTQGLVESFKGIPYAAPPLGDLRWRPPAPPIAWKGVRLNNEFGPICMQVARGPMAMVKMSEDCLTLNVWRPAGAKPGAKLPVMVWIYGGAFISGGSALPFYDGTHFAEKGVILVSLNYRLGRFGFFAHPALDGGKGPVANYGLMDQIAALKWVQGEIGAFGGDPSNVTIFGESAGALSVNYLLVSPAAQGLFSKAIAESGFGRDEPRPLKGSEHAAEAVGEAFAQAQGVKGDDAAAAAALRALPADALNAPFTGLGDPALPGPILDGKVVAEGISEGFEHGHEGRVPYLEGGNSYEASLFPHTGDLPDPVIARAGDPAKLIAAYGGQPPAEVAREVLTDRLITEPDRHLARQMAKQGLPVFVYHFSYVPEAMRAASFGASHGSEVSYVFGNLLDHPLSFGGRDIPAATPDDRKLSDAMHAYWVAFAKTGNPGTGDPAGAGGPAWPKVSPVDDVVLEFGADGVNVRHDYDKARLDLIEAAPSPIR